RLAPDAPVPPLIAQVLERQVAHMARLLDDLLDASRVTSGKVRLQRRPIRVDEFVGHAVEACRSLISAQSQQLTLALPELPIYVDGDPIRLEQVVSNLLHNAAKYTPEGGAIGLSARALGERVEIRVEDTGVGIAAEMLPHIFDLFTQNERSLNRSQGGLGIGLTVVRSMVELHGGSVQAFSPGSGRGSAFVVSLARLPEPVRSNDPPAPTAATAATAAPGPKPASVLLIDDNVDAAEMLAMLLEMSGHAVEIALDGPQGLACFERERPQVVLCDIGLPEMDGYEVARRMRASGTGNAGMPLMVALTGYDGPTARARALLAGFDRHLVKPVDPDEVLRLIDVFVQAQPPA
ncbi:MAG: ATP-binding protein, partial [Burkholderiaceae bacterium]